MVKKASEKATKEPLEDLVIRYNIVKKLRSAGSNGNEYR